MYVLTPPPPIRFPTKVVSIRYVISLCLMVLNRRDILNRWALSPGIAMAQDKFDHDEGQKSAISGRRLHWRLSTGIFAFSPLFMCNLVRRAP